MGANRGRKPLVRGRGVLRFEDFCRVSGLDQTTVESLMRAGHFEGGVWSDEEQTRPFGIFDDALPSRAALAELGLPVRDDYDPANHRTVEMTDNDDDPDAV